MFPNYIEINMEEDKLGDQVFAQAKTTKDFYMALSIVAGDRMKERENTLVFIDEIQAYDHLLTLVKFLMKEKRFTYIASGSLLGVALKNVLNKYNMAQSVVCGLGTAIGFTIAIVILAGIRERIANNPVPESFKGSPIVLITAALMAIAFMGFADLNL